MAGKREQTRTQNRLALIGAVLDSVAEKGIAETSVSEIIQRAGLSRGMVHLHFGGKDNLVDAAARHSWDQYYDGLDGFLRTAGSSGQERIEMILRGDLDPGVMNLQSARLWHAFRGEAQRRPGFAEHADVQDDRLRQMIQDAFEQIADEAEIPDASETAQDATLGTLALMEGMWTNYLLHPDRFDRAEAARVMFRFLAGLFPSHFTVQGAIAPSAG